MKTKKNKTKEELDSEIEVIKYIGENYYEYTNIEPYKDFSITMYGCLCKLVKRNLTLSEHTESK